MKPAILGGKPVFRKAIPFSRPLLPGIGKLTPRLKEILASGMITNGRYGELFENKVKDFIGVKNAVALSNATSGLILTLKCLRLTGEVIVPSFTFLATVHALIWNNLKPVFVDCAPETYNINVDLVEELITPRTSAILAVYVFGNPPEIKKLERIADKHRLKLIFDSAQAFGSFYSGRAAGNFGEAEIFSLSPTKLLTTSEGGIVTTNNDELAEALRIARNYGNPGDYDCEFVGLSARLPEFNAILGLESFKLLGKNLERRNEIVKRYKRQLGKLPGVSFQKISPDCRSSHKDFSILINEEKFGLSRDKLALALEKENIPTRKYFFPPIHRQKFFRSKGKYNLPVTEFISRNILCLPIFSGLTDKMVDSICSAILNIHQHRNLISSP